MGRDATESRWPTNGVEVRRFIASLDRNISQEKEQFDGACIVCSLLICGPDEQRISDLLELPFISVSQRLERLRRYRVIQGELMRIDWAEEDEGEIAFWLDCAVAEGDLSRSEKAGKLLYRITRRGRKRFRAETLATGRKQLLTFSDRELALLFDSVGLRGPIRWRQREKARALRFLLLLADPHTGLREVAAKARSSKTSLLRSSTVLRDRGLIRQIPAKRGHHHQLSAAGRRLVDVLAGSSTNS